MTQVVPQFRTLAIPHRVRRLAVETTRRPSQLTLFGAVSMALVMALLLLLAVLPTHASFLSRTVSVGVYGPYGELVPLALLVFGVGALALGRALALRLGGRPGRVCGRLVAVWATASLIDAVDPTNRSGQHTFHGEVHIVLAVTGLVAQVAVAAYFPVVLRRTRQHIPPSVLAAAALVFVTGGFFAVHPAGLAGLAERSLFVTSALWMIVAVRAAAGSVGPPPSRTSAPRSLDRTGR